MIAVVLRAEDDLAPARRYFAVGKPDQARAEWAAVDAAVALGQVATSPIRGEEPVQAVGEISAKVARTLGLADGQVKALGLRWPRRWIGEP